MSNDLVQSFLAAPIQEQARMVLDVRYAVELKAYLGEPAYTGYVALTEEIRRKLAEGHLAFDAPKNLLFVPGIMGSMLQSRTLGGVWWIDVARGWDKLNKLGLAPDGQTDLDPSYDIFPSGIDITYAPFQRAVLGRDDFGHDVFPYDWRKPLTYSTASMRDKLVQLYEENGHLPVHIVAHSMGGLITRATLAQYGDELWPKLGRIVFVATPHYGAPLAACRLKFHLWDRDALSIFLALLIKPETFRSLWGGISLIPAPRGIYPGTRDDDDVPWHSDDPQDAYVHPCANFDMYDVATWELDLPADAAADLQRILDYTAQFYRTLYDYHLGLDQSYRDRMAVIGGVGYQTAFRLAAGQGLFGGMKRDNRRVQGDPNRESDGTVPLASADLEYVGATRYYKGIHATLPNQPAVYDDVFRWLNGEPMQLPDSADMALSQHLGAGDDVPEYPNLNGPARERVLAEQTQADTFEPDPAMVEAVRAQIAAGEIPPELNLMRPF